MNYVFSEENKFRLWRKLWIALAESEKEAGLAITEGQVAELKKYAADVNYEVAEERERVVRHDVMSHVYAYGQQAKTAAPIIHLGATSCYVTDNSELLMVHAALKLVREKLLNVIDRLAHFCEKYKAMPVLGLTHLQPAQLTTMGKRASLWLYDVYSDFENLETLLAGYKLRGLKGATGTQASFLQLFGGDGQKVKELEKKVLSKLGFGAAYPVTGQTYSRKFDYGVLSFLSGVAQSAYKFSGDIRLLQSRKEVEEPFESGQIGSSAMAYKRNPMRCERIASIGRYVQSLAANAANTASAQWMERTLDDSANRRIVLAEAFLSVDAILNIYCNVAENLVVYPKIAEKYIREELPFMATENILMECVKAGGDRQLLHERLRVLSMEAGKNVKENGAANNLIELIERDAAFAAVHGSLDALLDAKNFTGRASAQVDEFLQDYIRPLLEKNKAALKPSEELTV
jgi:adenylosuccinate lyase